MTRTRPPSRPLQTDALLRSPLIHDLAASLDLRRRRHPLALHLAWGALARLHRSANRLDAELGHPGTWRQLVAAYNAGAAAHPVGIEASPTVAPLTSDTYRHFRDSVCSHPAQLEALLDAFTRHSVDLARDVGLLDPNGPGSLTRPHPTRVVYGDGTIVRPIYSQSPTGTRIDEDAAIHGRHDGTSIGNNLVIVATRGPEPYRRVILAVGRTPAPGGEAQTAVELFRRVHGYAGAGIQAIVYDGAFRGVHHQALMTELGVMVVNKVHPQTRDGDNKGWRPHPLGVWTHPAGRRGTCRHTLVALNGGVCDARTDEAGELRVSDPFPRQQVRRYARGRQGGWRYTLGVVVACPHGDFTAWISPHPQPGETTNGRPDQLRLLPEHDQHFQSIYGLRNDSEAINAAYKRTLLADRAAARGWPRQVLDLVSWALLGNSLARDRHHHEARAA